ncbi:hypothetical protein DRF65_02440 [Chryseobacterium pennae]|uniref:Uncharacterized protein n=1 Tax=Chryseobacterium pennae TaxID=2258962 RepID=A0A3D9CF91_9FLAO|nr:hypothetical protein DRF65_02440 [Chryseobacterium pennae]
MKGLKIISVISFLLIGGIQLHATVNLIMLLLYIYTLIQNIFSPPPVLDSSWESLLIIPIIGTIIIFLSCKRYTDRFLLLTCSAGLLLTLILLSGITDPDNYTRITFGFIIPFLGFIISSLLLIVKIFKTKEESSL